MAQQSPQSQPIAEFQLWGFLAKIYQKRVLIPIVLVSILSSFLFLVYKKDIKSTFDRLSGSESWTQYDNYVAIRSQVSTIIEIWNDIDSLDDRLRKDVQKIFEKINGVHERFSTLQIDKLSMGTQVYWRMDYARLNNILYDMYGDEKLLDKAVSLSLEAIEISTDSSKLTKEDLIKFDEYNVSFQLDWILLASYTLSSASGSTKYQDDLAKLVARLGGCEIFISDPITHKNMRKGLPCSL